MGRLEFFQISFCRFRAGSGVTGGQARGGMDKKRSDSVQIFGTTRMRTRFIRDESFADNLRWQYIAMIVCHFRQFLRMFSLLYNKEGKIA